MNRHNILSRTFAMLAALVLAMLCACGGAPAEPLSGAANGAQAEAAPAEGAAALNAETDERGLEAVKKTDEYIELINAELGELRRLGLFHLEFEAVKNGKESGGVDEVSIQNFQSDASCSYSVDFDKASGQITRICIIPHVQEDWESVTLSGGTEVYANYDAAIDPEMTLGDYCDAWAQYRGYERWELPEGVDGDILFLDAEKLEQWTQGIYDSGADITLPGLTISFYRAGETEPVQGYIQYNATTGGPMLNFGEDIVRG